jgi:adenylate kinase family enzyme
MPENRILIIGNSGSGKSWLARQLSDQFKIPVVHFDQHFWEPGGFVIRRENEIVSNELKELSTGKSWIMEGVYGELASIVIDRATHFIFLDKSWAECLSGLMKRGPQITESADKVDAEVKFKGLIDWAEKYWERQGSCSYLTHKTLFEQAGCKKILIQRNEDTEKLFRELL